MRPFRPVGKTLPISLIHIYWCETLGWEEAPAPTRRPGQTRLALRTGSMSPKSYSLSPDWLQSPPPSLLPFAPPPPLGLPSNRGRVAERYFLYYKQEQDSIMAPGGSRLRAVLWRDLYLSLLLGVGSGETSLKPRERERAEAEVVVTRWTGAQMGTQSTERLEEAAEPGDPGLSPHLSPTGSASLGQVTSLLWA